MKLAGALVALVIGGAVVGLAISGLYKPAAPPPAPAPIAKVEPPPPPPPAPPPPAPVIPPAPPPVVAAPPPRPSPGPGEPPLPRAVPHEQVTIAALPPPAGFTPQPPPAEAPVAPPVVPGSPGTPAWQRYAVASPPAAGRPMIAIVIDDMGVDRRRSETMLRLPAPLTMSYMSYAVGVSKDAAEAHAHGDELMEHVPMEPIAHDVDPGPGALLQSLPPAELQRRIDQALSAFTGYVGINNHEGSKFTAYGPGMSLVLAELKRRGLLFIDSRTSAKTVGLTMAREMGVPAAGRDVFLDDEPELAPVRRQLAATEAYARKHGSVIAIGHPKDATYEALAAWLPTLAAKGFQLVPVSAVVRARIGLKPAQAAVVRNGRP